MNNDSGEKFITSFIDPTYDKISKVVNINKEDFM